MRKFAVLKEHHLYKISNTVFKILIKRRKSCNAFSLHDSVRRLMSARLATEVLSAQQVSRALLAFRSKRIREGGIDYPSHDVIRHSSPPGLG